MMPAEFNEAIQPPLTKDEVMPHPATFDLDGAITQFQQRLEANDPAILEACAHVVREVDQTFGEQLETLFRKVMGCLAAMAQIDWAAIKRCLDELPEKSKAAMILASSKGWYFGWNDGLHSLMELVESLEITQSLSVNINWNCIAFAA